MDFIRQNPPGRAVDLGCGTGTNLLTLARAGWEVTGIDFAIKAVVAARRKLRGAGLSEKVRVGDVSNLDSVRGAVDQRFDLVLDIGCYHGLPQTSRAAYRANLPVLLAAGGVFMIYAHWKPDGGQQGAVGITASDIDAFQTVLTLESRQDSLDRRGRTACWMRFHRIE
jgi:SAM-dependent methyltransferase